MKKKEKKMCSYVTVTITKGVILAAHEITSYPQQIPGICICKLKFKISSAEVKSLEIPPFNQ